MKNTHLLYVIAALLIIVALFLTSCSSTRQLAKIQANHPAALAKACADWYPGVITKDSTVIRYIKGKDQVGPVQWVTIDCDSVARINQTRKTGDHVSHTGNMVVRIPCPPSILRVDTTQYSRYLEKESTAKLAVKEAELADTRGQLEVSDRRADKLQDWGSGWKQKAIWAFVALGAIAVGFIVKLYLKFKPF